MTPSNQGIGLGGLYLDKVARELVKYRSTTRVSRWIKQLTTYHRIQGSDDLVKASEFLEKELKEWCDTVDRIMITREHDLGLLKIPPRWNVRDAELWLKKPKEKLLLKLSNHPTMVVAHSPPTNGWVEGEVVNVGRGVSDKDYPRSLEGKFVLAYGSARIVYRKASERGALGILLYSKRNIPSHAVPYFGLFLSYDELKDKKTIALSISRRIADELINMLEKGEKVVVRAYVNAELSDNSRLPVIVASIQGTRSEGFGVVAHYCHPMPGANDNASGVVGALETAAILSTAIKNGLPKLEKSVYFMLVPEYYGTQGLLLNNNKELTKKLLGVINLDMIGERQEDTGSVLSHILSSIALPTYIDAVLDYTLRKLLPGTHAYSEVHRPLMIRYTISPYNDGSDHDVFLSEGIPAMMLNQWPDKYYHTDLDDIAHVDLELITKISASVATTLYYLSTLKEPYLEELVNLTYDFYSYVIYEWKFTRKINDHLASILAKHYSRGIELIHEHYGVEEACKLAEKLRNGFKEEKAHTFTRSDTRKPKRVFKGILSLEYIRSISKDVYDELIKMVEDNPKLRVVLMREALFLANGKRTLNDIYLALTAEYSVGAVSFDDLTKFFDLLERVKLIEYQ